MPNVPTPANILSITYQLLQQVNDPASVRGQLPILTVQFQDNNSVIRNKIVTFQEMLPYLRMLHVKALSLGKVISCNPEGTFDKKIVLLPGFEGDNAFPVLVSLTLFGNPNVCQGIPGIKFIDHPGALAVGDIVYDDIAKTTPTIGFSFVRDAGSGDAIFTMNPATAQVLVNTGDTCSTLSVLVLNSTDSPLEFRRAGAAFVVPINNGAAIPKDIDFYRHYSWQPPYSGQPLVSSNGNAGLRFIYKLAAVPVQTDTYKPYGIDVFAFPIIAFDEVEIFEDLVAMEITVGEDSALAGRRVSVSGFPKPQADNGMDWANTDIVLVQVFDIVLGTLLWTQDYLILGVGTPRSNQFTSKIDATLPPGYFTPGTDYLVQVSFAASDMSRTKQIISRVITATAGDGVACPAIASNDLLTHCEEPIQRAYTTTGGISAGQTVYTDDAMTIPLAGFTFISNGAIGDIFAIDVVTGVVGADTGNNCP